VRWAKLRLFAIVIAKRSALCSQTVAIFFYSKKGNRVALPGEGFVENENGRLHPRIWIETARREGNDGDKGAFNEHFSQDFVGVLILEDDALGDDDASATDGREVLGHVVHEEDFAALGLDGEAAVGLYATFRR